jgi:nucleotide-binding universal stress UspA family protein
MKTIVVPLDGSAVAEQILPYVRLLAPLLSARVRLLRVVSNEEVAHVVAHDGALAHELGDWSPPAQLDAPRVTDLLRQRAADYLGARAVELREAGMDVDVVVRHGAPAEQIVELVEHDRESLIALATHGYSGLRRWALGSVADKVLHAATTPVFLVRAVEQPHARALSFKRIIVPLDGSPLAEQALPHALALARKTQAELTVVRVVIPLAADAPGLAPFARLLPPSFTYPEVLREQAQQQLATTIDRYAAHELFITPVVVFGFPAEEIINEAEHHRDDLIVMATHGYGGLRRWGLGSVADKVLHASTIPLLLVRAQHGRVDADEHGRRMERALAEL